MSPPSTCQRRYVVKIAFCRHIPPLMATGSTCRGRHVDKAAKYRHRRRALVVDPRSARLTIRAPIGHLPARIRTKGPPYGKRTLQRARAREALAAGVGGA